MDKDVYTSNYSMHLKYNENVCLLTEMHYFTLCNTEPTGSCHPSS